MHINFIQDIIDTIRGKKKTKEPKKTISKEILANNNINIPKKNIKNFNLVLHGKNNTIILNENNRLSDNAIINISLNGDNNFIIFNEGFGLSSYLSIEVGRKHPNYGEVQNCSITIGEGTTIESATFVMVNSNSHIKIGKNCMFANDITLYNTDTHPVLDLSTGKMINYVKGIEIGEHCWLGRNCTILKNTTIANDCIVGWGAIVSGKHTQEHSVIAGNPAKIVKSGVTWDSNTIAHNYVQNKIPEGEI